jgi:hypothetical protein
MRFQAPVTTVSWIRRSRSRDSKMVFASGVGHYGDPPPDMHDHCFGDWWHAEFNLGVELHNPSGQQTRSSSRDEVVRSQCLARKTRSSA